MLILADALGAKLSMATGARLTIVVGVVSAAVTFALLERD